VTFAIRNIDDLAGMLPPIGFSHLIERRLDILW